MMPGEGGLAQAGRPGQEHVLARLAAGAGGLEEDRELLLDLLLADELGQAPRPQRAVELLLARRQERVGDAEPASALIARPGRAAPDSASRTRSSTGRSSSIGAGPPRPRRPTSPGRRGRRGRPCGRRRRRRPAPPATATDAADLVLQVDHDPLGGAPADAGDAREEGVVAGRDGPPDLVGRIAGHDRERGLGPHAGDAQQQLEQRALAGPTRSRTAGACPRARAGA